MFSLAKTVLTSLFSELTLLVGEANIVLVRAENETIGPNLTWAHNLFIGWTFGFPTLGRSRYRNSE